MGKKITIKDIKNLRKEERFLKKLNQETISYIRKKNYKVKEKKSEKIVNLIPFILNKRFIPATIAASLLIFFIYKIELVNNYEIDKIMENASIGKEFSIGTYDYKLEKKFKDADGNLCYIATAKYNMDVVAYGTTKNELKKEKNRSRKVNICYKSSNRWIIDN